MKNLPSKVPGVLGDTSLDRFDVVIIGSGPAGSAAAQVLSSAGLKLCILEAGPNYFHGLDDPAPGMPIPVLSSDELKLSAREMIDQHARVEPRTFRTSPEDGARLLVGEVNNLPRTVGGGSVHADVKLPRFNEVDFRFGKLLGDVPGASFADWPLTYDELEPYYTAAEEGTGVAGLSGANPFESRRSREFPMPPPPPMYVASVLSEGAAKLGLTPFPLPSGQNTRDYRGRPPCVDCGFCAGYGCPTNAKGSAAVTSLRGALLSGNVQLRTNCTATRLATDPAGRRVTAVEYLDPEGRPARVTGDRVILAASPIESARLCFLSDPDGPGLGNSSGLVGRNLMFHHQTIGVGIYPQRFHGERGRAVTTGIADWRGVPNDPERPLGGVIEFGSNSEKIADALVYMLTLGIRGSDLKAFLRSSPFGAHLAALSMQGEDAPQPTNRVDLDPEVRDVNGIPVPRITYRPHAFELRAREFYGPKMIELHGAAGAQFAFVSPIYDGDRTPGSRHIMGTLRMGTDPRTSVTNAFGRFHDVDNLYCTDGSVFPTSSGYNPTLTIGAVALRTAAAMVDAQHPESVLQRL